MHLLAYIPVHVAAGFPSPAGDYIEQRISLDELLIKHPQATFIIKSEGDSMIEAFIPPEAHLIIDRSLTAKSGDIVLAVVNGEFTVKYLKKNEFKCWLVAGNKKYQDIEITPEMQMVVWGVVSGIIIEPKNARHVRIG